MIQRGKAMGQLGAQAVKDHRQALKKKGDPQPLERYESLQGNTANVESAFRWHGTGMFHA